MTKRPKKRAKTNDDAIWDGAEILSAVDTHDAKVHVTLRLDPALYRDIVAAKKTRGERTITSTIERVLRSGLLQEEDVTRTDVARQLRNIVVHGVAQDAILVLLARHLKLDADAKSVADALQAYIADALGFTTWLSEAAQAGKDVSEPSPGAELIRAVFDPDILKRAS